MCGQLIREKERLNTCHFLIVFSSTFSSFFPIHFPIEIFLFIYKKIGRWNWVNWWWGWKIILHIEKNAFYSWRIIKENIEMFKMNVEQRTCMKRFIEIHRCFRFVWKKLFIWIFVWIWKRNCLLNWKCLFQRKVRLVSNRVYKSVCGLFWTHFVWISTYPVSSKSERRRLFLQ